MIERAIYSLWTKPMTQGYVGFNSEKALMECFALSLHYSKKWFKEIHFITDIKGKKLIEKYGLTFDSISTELEEALKDTSVRDWSLGKIYACKIQDKPFIHIDNDVILFKKLPDSFLSKDAVFQSSERNDWPFYHDMMHFDAANYKQKPEWYNTQILKAYNCGLLGFNKLNFLDEWWEASVKHVEYLKQYNGYPDTGLLSCLTYEQQYVGCLCDYYNYSVGLLTHYDDTDPHTETIDDKLAEKLGYTHLLAQCKREKLTEDKVTLRLVLDEIRIPGINN